MADVRIKDLGTEATSLNTSDFLVTDTTAETKKISPANLANDLHKKAVTNATAKTTLLSTDNILVDESGTTKKIAGNYFAKTDNWGNPKGGAKLDGVDDYYSVADNDNLDFGTGDFSISFNYTHKSATGSDFLLSKGGGGLQGYSVIVNSANMGFDIQDNAIRLTKYFTQSLVVGRRYNIVYVINRGSQTIDGYVNGVIDFSGFNISTLIGSVDNANALGIGAFFNGTEFTQCDLEDLRFFNRALTTSEVTKYYNNGRPDLAELDYSDKGASNTNLITNGTFDADTNWTKDAGWTISAGVASCDGTQISNSNIYQSLTVPTVFKKFRLTFTISNYSAGSVFSQIGGYNASTARSSNGTFVEEITASNSGSAPVFYLTADADFIGDIDNVILIPIGCVAEYKGDGFGRIGLIDSSGNGLHGTSSGSPIALSAEQGLDVVRDVKTLVTGNTTLTSVVPKGYMLKQIIVNNTTANAYTLNVGSATSGGTDVVNASSIGASGFTTITVNKTFSATAAQTLYLQSGAWNSSSSTYYLIMERVAR